MRRDLWGLADQTRLAVLVADRTAGRLVVAGLAVVGVGDFATLVASVD